MISKMIVRCVDCKFKTEIVSRDSNISVDMQAKRDGWLRIGPASWRCPNCEDRLQEARFEAMELRKELEDDGDGI